jgi:hypothetical protein
MPPKAATVGVRRRGSLGSRTDILPDPDLLRAMFDVGYFPPNTPLEPQH